MILDPKILVDLAVAITPKSYVRVTPMAHAATPLGAGFGVTRFASPTKTFEVIHLAQVLTTAIAETLGRDLVLAQIPQDVLGIPSQWRASVCWVTSLSPYASQYAIP